MIDFADEPVAGIAWRMINLMIFVASSIIALRLVTARDVDNLRSNNILAAFIASSGLGHGALAAHGMSAIIADWVFLQHLATAGISLVAAFVHFSRRGR